MTTNVFNFTVSVDTSGTEAIYTIFDEQGNPTTAPITIDQHNTTINYTLRPDSNALRFVAPQISGDSHDDLSVSISQDGQRIAFDDTDNDIEDICVRLVTQSADGVHYVSPDPQMLNRPPM